jgi:hypothetical protein
MLPSLSVCIITFISSKILYLVYLPKRLSVLLLLLLLRLGASTAGACHFCYIQGDQKVCVELMITIQEVTSNVESVPSQFLDIY